MREYGGYIELDTYRLPMLHKGAIALNCGRNCLAYLFGTRKIRKLKLPYYMCDSVFNLCRKYGVEMSFYHVNDSFYPEDIKLSDDEWLYVMNYYGQLERGQLEELKSKYKKVIIDNAQAYFDEPLEDTDTLYTCRKFFGVPDGAFLYTDSISEEEYPTDESFERMRFLLGRYERNASEFYQEYSANDHMFADEPILKISKLTKNLLHGIDYEFVKQRRTKELDEIVTKFNLNREKTFAFIDSALENDYYSSDGSDFSDLLPKTSRFSQSNERRASITEIDEALRDYFELYKETV